MVHPRSYKIILRKSVDFNGIKMNMQVLDIDADIDYRLDIIKKFNDNVELIINLLNELIDIVEVYFPETPIDSIEKIIEHLENLTNEVECMLISKDLFQ